MYKKMLLLTSLFCITTSPLFASDEIDFYSKIDDAGNEIADAITTRHLKEYKNFQGFGKRCRGEAPWLDSEKISETDLRNIQGDDYSFLSTLAKKKQKNLDINEINTIATCLKTTYGEMQRESIRQQEQISTAGGYGIYMDGSLKNSDYDIIDDINKINKIIFTQPPKYNGPANTNQKSLLDFLSGKEAEGLADADGNSEVDDTNITTITQVNTTISTPTISDSDGNALPWTSQCSDPSAGGGSATNPDLPDNLFDGNFRTDLSNTITQGNNSQNGGVDNSQNANTQANANSQSNKDFFHKVPCNKMFCITIDFITNTKSGGGGGNDKSIESLLDKHIKMMEPISRSDLSAQKMTNNSFQLPFLNIKIADKIAGARVFMHNKPQKVKRLKSEDTEEKRKSIFDEAYRCALIEAGLQPDEKKNAGVQGAGYSLIDGQTLADVANAEKTLSPQDPVSVTKNPNIQTKCKDLRQDISKQKRETVFEGDLNEFYSFTEAMSDIIMQMLDSEGEKLDGLPTR